MPIKKLDSQQSTDIAVLRVRFDNLDEKVDDLKIEIKGMHASIDRNMSENKNSLKEFQEANKKSHEDLSKKISSIEKVKWMLMGAAAVLGASGVQAFKLIFG